MTIPLSTSSVIDTVNAIRNILNIEQRLSGLEYLKVLIRNISTELGVKYVFVGTPVKTGLISSTQMLPTWMASCSQILSTNLRTHPVK
ncbi:MAG: hypothetical protein OQK98_07330 [Gammaproteobacteria bacterium]|nr:hypothetical protein [Gammaproteobacteria bacterium]